MILGMSIAAFTTLHVVISLVAIACGLIVMFGLIARNRLDGWTAFFLATTAASVVTGFLFPFVGITPAYIFGVLTTIALIFAVVARYQYKLAGGWRRTYVISASIALYLNSFIAVVQAFRKLPALRALAPTESEAPFAAAHLFVLAFVTGLAIAAAKKFRDFPAGLAPR